MSDTPDFENMSPEEMMRWMESLAKRQGADPSSFTTDADLEIEEVSADDERLEETGEYIPYGWTKDKWEAHLAREAEEKAARAASSPASTDDEDFTTPIYTPEPVAELDNELGDGGAPMTEAVGEEMPDFDSMSPEEAMRWMESLAKRQGADPSSFLTEADMDVEEISADDARLADTGEYIPYGWTKDKWEAHLAKEAEEKAAKPTPPSSADLLPSFDEIDASDYEDADEEFQFVSEVDEDISYEVDDDDMPFDFDEDNVIDLDSLDEEEEPVWASITEDDDEEEPLWASITSDDDEDDEFNLDDLTSTDEADYEDEIDDEPMAEGDNPMSWLSSLANDEPMAEEIDLSALEEVEAKSPAALDPMGWLAELAAENRADTVPDLQNLDLGEIGENLTGLNEIAASAAAANEGENPIAWIESLARDQGAPAEELSTSADMTIERPSDFTPDGPGYEPYSFETGGKPLVDEEDLQPEPYIDEETVADMDMSDPSAWLDALASGVSGGRSGSGVADMDDVEDGEEATETISRLNAGEDVSPEEVENFFDAMFKQAEQYADRDLGFDEDEDLPSDAIPAEIPDWLQEQMNSESLAMDMPEDEDEPEGEMSAEQANAMLEQMFGTDEMQAVAVDDFEMPADMMLEEIDDEFVLEDDDGEFVLEDSGDFAIDEDLDLSSEDIPDWLTEEIGDDEAVLADIFATDGDAADDEPLMVDVASGVAASVEAISMDSDDNWVEAFEVEADPTRQQELAAWYAQSMGEDVAASAPVMQTAELPLERNLPLGQAELVPDWLAGEIAGDVAVASAAVADVAEFDDIELDDEDLAATEPFTLEEGDYVEQDLPDWLSDTGPVSDIPDWLQTDAVEAVEDEDLPDWLNVDAEVDVEDIPDWLRETMDEEEEAQAITLEPVAEEQTFTDEAPEIEEEPIPAPAVQPQPQPALVPVQQPRSPAPVPVAATQVNVAAMLENARSKVSSGAVDDSLHDYETVIRANTALDEVVNDLKKLSEDKDQKKNTAVYRVLGDGLMRQGKLQDALETYRKALKML
ncbi:MAG: hypothetical protein KC615_11150 [Anaerolineae bacterium]|nr:hypothetical protein [Anaerolineae bacterium]